MRTLVLYIFIKFIFVFLNLFEVNAQCTFHRLYTYNDTIYDFGNTVIQTLDGGFISVGNTNTVFSPIFEGIFIVKTDKCGDTLWQRAYDFSPLGGDPGNSVIQLQDSTYVICGWRLDSIEGARDTYLLKLNQDGDIIWYKPVDAGYNDFGIIHKQTKDEGFIIGGYKFDSVMTASQIFLIKTDSTGNIQWQQEYIDSAYLYAIDKSQDGGYILSGEILNPASNSWDLFLIKTDSIGNLEWEKYYGDNYSQFQGYAVTTIDGGYVMVGRTYDAGGDMDGYILKTDSLGNVEWEKVYGTNDEFERFKFVRQLPEG
ncbi:MAG: hypothetical protein ABII90_08200, partial [Bacteroidota bacterium]